MQRTHGETRNKNEQDINEYVDIQNSENFFSSFNNEQSNNSISTSKFHNELDNENNDFNIWKKYLREKMIYENKYIKLYLLKILLN